MQLCNSVERDMVRDDASGKRLLTVNSHWKALFIDYQNVLKSKKWNNIFYLAKAQLKTYYDPISIWYINLNASDKKRFSLWSAKSLLKTLLRILNSYFIVRTFTF